MWKPGHQVCVFLILMMIGLVLGLGTGIAVTDGMRISRGMTTLRTSQEIAARAGMGVFIGCLVVLILLIWLICRSVHPTSCGGECDGGGGGSGGEILPPVDSIEELTEYSKNLIVFGLLVNIVGNEQHVTGGNAVKASNSDHRAALSGISILNSELLKSIPTLDQGASFFDQTFQSNANGDILIDFENYRAGVAEHLFYAYNSPDVRNALINFVYNPERTYESTWELFFLNVVEGEDPEVIIYEGELNLILEGDSLKTLAARTANSGPINPLPEGKTLQQVIIEQTLKFPLYSLPTLELFSFRLFIIELPP